MADKFEHLDLPFIPNDFLRRMRGGGGYKKFARNEYEVSQQILQSFDEIQKKHNIQKRKYENHLNPNLIFKIEVNQGVSEDSFRDVMRRAGIEVISPSPDKKGYWIVFAEDEELSEFKRRLNLHVQEDRYKFLYAVNNFSDIPPEEKIGESLQREPFRVSEVLFLNLELWRMEDSKLEIFVNDLYDIFSQRGGEINDVMTTRNFCLLRIKINHSLYLDLLQMAEVRNIERIPKVRIETILNQDLADLDVEGTPSDDASGILIVDSGILSNHPLLENAVGHEISIPTGDGKLLEDSPFDDVGHGTQVAGIALYGDLKECIDKRVFSPEIWIFSAKVMYKDEYGDATFDEKQLLEHQLASAVRKIVGNYPNCKVINLSFGYAEYRMWGNKNQFNLASLVDDLAKELNVVFVISTGNFDNGSTDSYPHYLLDESNDLAKIIDPATSALAITVGGLFNTTGDYATLKLYPSPKTRVGLGYQGMIKPELVECCGGGFGEENDIVTINPNWIRDGRLFTLAFGTSMSAPKVSHYIAKLINKYPDKTSNLIKALLLSSASIPSERPSNLANIKITSSEKDAKDLMKVYGYGQPDLNKAMFSESNRVLLMRENSVKVNNFHIYEINLPEDFLENRGRKVLSVTLVYDPPINKNRTDYLGVKFETHLFKNTTQEEVKSKYEEIEIETHEEEIVPERGIRLQEIKLHPGNDLRKRGVHQKGFVEYGGRSPSIDLSKPLNLVIICQNKWISDESYIQNYAIVVSIEYFDQVDIVNGGE